MRPFRSALATAATLCAVATGVVIAQPPQPAAASAADCEGGAHNFRDHPDDAEGDTVKPRRFDVGNVHFTLEKGAYVGQQIAFGKISGQTRPGDNVWMDWRANGWDNAGAVSPWLQCGPFTVRTAGQSLTTPFKRTSTDPQYQFRVCGSLISDGVVRCSDWW
ncbi:hypothetical protein [Streptomyces sp. NPDC058291]|jgi:hypothetical protein|uniref:hypothetical protein n=1 Tax=Streptomyces sp. NPDC058291 TaxID=3346427 RepID=UPI0036EFF0EB